MTISSAICRNDYTGTGATATYPYAFRILQSSDLLVIQTDTSGVETTLVLGTDYSVTGVGSYSGGNVVLSANLASGYGLAIKRVVPLTQPTSIRNQGSFLPSVHEDVFDRLTMIDQQQQDAIDRSLSLPEGSVGIDASIPALIPNYSLVANAAGDGFDFAPNTAADQLADLADTTDAAKGSGRIGFNYALGYAAGTIGSWLKGLAAGTGASLLGYLSPLTGAVVRTLAQVIADLPVSPKWFGAVGDGTTDDTAAFQAAIDSLPLNTADIGILSPKGFANGGEIRIPRGRYKITGTLTMKRGLHLVGESRESTQLVSFTTGSVLKYLDSGRYIQDEIVIENLSIWQDPSVVANSGAAIETFLGPASVESLGVIVRNVIIEGTYRGILLGAGIWSSFDNVNALKCVLYGFDVRYTTGGTGASTSTTSTTLKNCYAYLCQSGFRIERGAYCSFLSCASDSNTEYGYVLEYGSSHSCTSCGAEGNGIGAFHLDHTSGIVLMAPYAVWDTSATGTRHGITLTNAYDTTIIGGSIDATTLTDGYGIHVAAAGGKVTCIGTAFLNNFLTRQIDSTSKVLMLTADGGLFGNANKWSIGRPISPDTTALWNVGGTGDSTTTNGQIINVTHTVAGVTRNTQLYTQFVSSDTAVTYPLVIGHFIHNASKGAAATHSRSAGQFINEQTTGSTANANTMVNVSAGTVPAGNWDHYSDSSRRSFWKSGDFQFLTTSGPIEKWGTGTPEGVVTAVVGSVFHRTDGGAGTCLYIKESGTGNTGWVAK